MISDLLITVGLIIDLLGAIIIVGFDIGRVRRAGISIQSYLTRKGILNGYNWYNLDLGYRKLLKEGNLDPEKESSIHDIAEFILKVGKVSGIVPGDLMNRTYDSIRVNRIHLVSGIANVDAQINMIYEDPSVPARDDITPIKISKLQLHQMMEDHLERRFLIVGVGILGIGIFFQLLGYIIGLQLRI